MANFEAFRWVISSSINLLFLMSERWTELNHIIVHYNNDKCNGLTWIIHVDFQAFLLIIATALYTNILFCKTFFLLLLHTPQFDTRLDF